MTPRLAPYVTVTRTEHGAVLLDERTGRYWQVNTTAHAVLACVAEGRDLEPTVNELCARFPDAADRIADDVRVLLETLRNARLVTP